MSDTGDKKDSDNVDNKDTEWDFNLINPAQDKKSSTEPCKEKAKTKTTKSLKNESLKLDTASVPKSKTRSAMAKDINPQELEKDFFEFAPYISRGIAFILDLALLMALAFFVKFSSLVWRQVVQIFMDRYNLQFIIAESDVMKIINVINAFVTFFFIVIIPAAFFNVSFGKKVMGLRVRGLDKYSISIEQAFKRELIMKPISILIIVGFITPFFSKNRQSIHDMVAGTIVIKD